jgi:hypothetical protein
LGILGRGDYRGVGPKALKGIKNIDLIVFKRVV